MRTLESTLDAVRELMSGNDRNVWPTIEGLYRALGAPQQPTDLKFALDAMMTECRRRGLRFPKIVYMRWKQLQRGDWVPLPEGVFKQTQTQTQTPELKPIAIDHQQKARKTG